MEKNFIYLLLIMVFFVGYIFIFDYFFGYIEMMFAPYGLLIIHFTNWLFNCDPISCINHYHQEDSRDYTGMTGKYL
ncbi:hypothetical protein [Bacillus sp. ISL-45]|uniref:hypothetical protein n=1 Tax=Bacillus sp. ISL-45 TaxID=2819128 RepID=UPI001BE99B3C|nr:hypothetical protein [Bacillus sp. ISL-45]MBT2663414.1 hypothetical protein [Bacillus sp. ISL-45]